ncbi:type II toxin-antitoxin system HicA family toxin [Nonlabens sp.]|jgi:hypothetical protein|uniref:type II toxin-antitoxin system HicA family toxin n=1 Tax=Nonlabens sp. TaxID=1888209 RepID=UPI0039E6E161
MSTKHLRNIPLKLYRDFLSDQGCVCNRKSGGHEHWSRKDLLRPITIQTHIDPVPEFIIKNGLRQLGVSKKSFLDWI